MTSLTIIIWAKKIKLPIKESIKKDKWRSGKWILCKQASNLIEKFQRGLILLSRGPTNLSNSQINLHSTKIKISVVATSKKWILRTMTWGWTIDSMITPDEKLDPVHRTKNLLVLFKIVLSLLKLKKMKSANK